MFTWFGSFNRSALGNRLTMGGGIGWGDERGTAPGSPVPNAESAGAGRPIGEAGTTREANAGGARTSGGATRWLDGATIAGAVGQTGGVNRSIRNPTFSRSASGAWVRGHSEPTRSVHPFHPFVRSRPRRASDIRFVSVEIVAGSVPARSISRIFGK